MAKVAGSLWVEGNDLHYVDQFNREWKIVGSGVIATSGKKPGSIWVETNTHGIRYINEAGTAIYATPITWTAWAPGNTREGSIWIGQDNLLHWLKDAGNGYKSNVVAHTDVPAVAGHDDTHGDSPHTDTPHYDTPHSDIPYQATHIDEHADSPHYDFTDYYHGDTPPYYQNFNDFSDQAYYYHPEYINATTLHGDYWSPGGSHHEDYAYQEGQGPPKGSQHVDGWNHTDVPHGDQAHQDFHNDRPHTDEAPEYGHDDHSDSIPHTDVPHTDVPPVSGHTDAHTDGHTDTPHNDNPLLIGP